MSRESGAIQDIPGAPWRDDRHPEAADRLDTPVCRCIAPHPRQNSGGDGGVRRLTVVQCRQPDAGAGSVDAHDHVPNQSSVAKAFLEFDESGRMKPSSNYERAVDVMEELVKSRLLMCDCADYLLDRYSERRESAKALSKRVNQRSI